MSEIKQRTITGHINDAVTPKASWRRYPSIWSLLGSAFTVYLVYLFLTGGTFRFYASFLFAFYHLTKRMWISVMMLGVFQTLLMIPLRAINIRKSTHIKEFADTLKAVKESEQQSFLLKKQIQQGDRVAIFYWLNFIIQTISYLSLGRLFLTDFYRFPLDPQMLYDWVPYPQYPIKDVIFKIPYLWASNTKDLGFTAVIYAWLTIALLQAIIYVYRSTRKKKSSSKPAFISKLGSYFTGSTIILCLLMWGIIRHFPTGLKFYIFSGDITRPYPKFNFITAVATTFTVLWLKIPQIFVKSGLAREAGVSEAIIAKTQRDMFANTLRNAVVIGLGAYFITNQIPSAFELSIFTLEVISLLAPLTLDRMITNAKKPQLFSQEKEAAPSDSTTEQTTPQPASADAAPKSNSQD